MIIKIIPGTNSKLADAELHFTKGPLAGLRLLGFAIWERGRGVGLNVTFPARQYSVNGERRNFALLRPTESLADGDTLRDQILQAYRNYTNTGLELQTVVDDCDLQVDEGL